MPLSTVATVVQNDVVSNVKKLIKAFDKAYNPAWVSQSDEPLHRWCHDKHTAYAAIRPPTAPPTTTCYRLPPISHVMPLRASTTGPPTAHRATTNESRTTNAPLALHLLTLTALHLHSPCTNLLRKPGNRVERAREVCHLLDAKTPSTHAGPRRGAELSEGGGASVLAAPGSARAASVPGVRLGICEVSSISPLTRPSWSPNEIATRSPGSRTLRAPACTGAAAAAQRASVDFAINHLARACTGALL